MQVETAVFIDNVSVGNIARRIAHGKGVPKKSPYCAAWNEVARLISLILPIRVYWVPSHGKHEEWKAPPPFREAWVRKLNNEADAAASTVLRRDWKNTDRNRRQWEAAAEWSRRAMRLLTHVCEDLEEEWTAVHRNSLNQEGM